MAGAAIGNVFARRGELAGASVAGSTAWAMLYGAAALAAFALATGKTWSFEPTWSYTLSLLHLSLNGSVIAFLLYYGLARRRGYTTASYISALEQFRDFPNRNWDSQTRRTVIRFAP